MAPQARGFAPGNMQISGDEIQETLQQKRDGLKAMQAQVSALPLGQDRANLANLAELEQRNLRDASAAAMTARTGGEHGSLNSDMNGVLAFDYARHKAKGFKSGGVIRGPGTGTSDAIAGDMRPGTFIMPADSTREIGPGALKNLAKVPVRVSNGEFEFTPEQVQSIGAAVLTALKDATHEPVQKHADGGIVGRKQMSGPGKKEYNEKFAFGPGTGRDMAPYDFTTGFANRGFRVGVNPQRLFGGGTVAFGGLDNNVQRAGYGDADEAERVRQRGMRFNATFARDQRRIDRWEDAQSPEGQLKAAQTMDELTRFTSPQSRQLRDWDTEQRYRGMQQRDFQQTGYMFADGGLVNPLAGVGEYWSNSNAEFEAQNPNLLQRGVRAINPVTGFGSAVGAMHDGASVGSARDMAIAAMQAVPVFGAMRAVAPAVKTVAGAAPAVLVPSMAKTAARGAKGAAAGVAADEAQARGFANGGRVRPRGFVAGKGTATSDSIPARLSNGEYVLPADTVKAVGVDQLDALREATHKPVKGEGAKAARGFFAGGTPGGLAALYQDWQSKKQPWYMPTPRGNMEERTAEANYSQALRNQFEPKPAAPPAVTTTQNPTDQRLAQGKQQSPAMPPPAKTAAPQANAQAESANVGVGNMGREGMTNAQVGAANPQGRIKVERQANGILSLSGSDVRGDPSYTDARGNPLAGGGLRGKGFGSFVVAPAGAHVAMGPNGSYAFANEAPAKRAVPQSSDPSQARGFAPGMSAEQMAQYAREVEAARANMVGNQIVANARGNQAVRDWNDLRSPVGIARRNLEFDMNNGPIDRSLSGRSGGAGGGGASVAQQAAAAVYRDLAGAQFRTAGNEAPAAAEQQRWQYEAERKDQSDAAAQGLAYRKYGLAADELGMKREAQGFQTRAAAQQEQLRNVLLDPKSTPEQRAVAQRYLAALSGKTAADRMQTVALPDTTNEMGQVVRGGQALVRVLEDGTVQQVPIGAQAPAPIAAPKAGEVRNGYRFKGGNPNDQANWTKV